VETTKRMVISYNNLLVRLWLNGAIMPYVDGGYASEHIHNTVPKDEEELANDKKEYMIVETKNDGGKEEGEQEQEQEQTQGGTIHNDDAGKVTEENEQNQEGRRKNTHIDTLIDSKGCPPVPHGYWVDRLGFQQTDPVTDFRSGGVLSLAMLVHIVETCPNVHARFLPSGDTHMLPFGITCINITDMLAKFCMFSKSVDRMDALLSQKPFWRMFADPNSLLVLQELSMEVLCNVVVEMGRERRMPKVKEENANESFSGQHGTDKVTVFDFAEILATTEKRVNDDLLGSGPKSVDDLRAIHTRNYNKYMKALERKEQQAKRQYERAMKKKNSSGIESANEFLASAEGAKKAITENVIGTAGGVLNKFKGFGLRSKEQPETKKGEEGDDVCTEEVDFADFAVAKDPKPTEAKVEEANTKVNSADLFDMSDAPPPPVIEKTTEISVDELFDFGDDEPASNFTIDDDEEDFI